MNAKRSEMSSSAPPRQRGEQQAAGAELRRTIPIADHRIDSRDLFSDTREITIAHGDGLYRLRLTSQNKLILTK